MPASCLVVSQREADIEFGSYLSKKSGFTLAVHTSPNSVREYLIDHPQTIVIWDGDDKKLSVGIAQSLVKESSPLKVFAVTDQPLNQYPHLFQVPAFGHHLYRRYDTDAAKMVYSRIATSALIPHPFGLSNFFPGDSQTQKITLAKSSQKNAAVEAVQNYFTKLKLNNRMAALVAQAADELLMNAVFDAPTKPNGQPLKRQIDRATDFELEEKERVQLEVAHCNDYTGICVSDQFGSLKKDVLLSFLRKDYQEEAYSIRKNDGGAGLGLHGLIQAGLSLLFVSKPKIRTEVMVFFPNATNYKEFREGFRFLSIMAD